MGSRFPTRALLAAGILGPVLFIATFLVEGATRTGYDPVRHFVSLLSLGDGGWVQVANFVACGGLIAAFGFGLRRTWLTGPASTWAPRLMILVGAALAWCGMFSTDPALGYPAGTAAGLPTSASWQAGLHDLGASVVFVGLPAAIVIAARRWPTRGSFAYAWLSAGVMVGGWLAGFILGGPDGASPIAGLLQRVAVVAGFQWIVLTAFYELRSADEGRVPAAAPIAAGSGR
jgi:hypothetical membrane protein